MHSGLCECHVTLSVTAACSFCPFNQDVWRQPDLVIFSPSDTLTDFWTHFSVSWWQVICRTVLESCQCFSNPHMTSTGCHTVQELLLKHYSLLSGLAVFYDPSTTILQLWKKHVNIYLLIQWVHADFSSYICLLSFSTSKYCNSPGWMIQALPEEGHTKAGGQYFWSAARPCQPNFAVQVGKQMPVPTLSRGRCLHDSVLCRNADFGLEAE